MNTASLHRRRVALGLRALLVVSCVCAGAHAQCPADFSVYFNDQPDLLSGSDTNRPMSMTAIAQIDLDGAGPQAPVFIAAFNYRGSGCFAGTGVEYSRLDRWDTSSQTWVPITGRFDGFVSSLTAFDEDQTGPNPPRLYIGGRFSGFGAPGGAVVPCANIMRYDGAVFSGVRNGVNGDVHCMLVFDDDAAGPVLPKLYVGGDMTAAHASDVQGQVNCGRLLRLTGGQLWQNPSSGFDDRVFALCSFDQDGPGAGIPRLVVGGAFSRNDTQSTHTQISVWNGSTWSTLGTGLDRSLSTGFGSGRRVFTLAEFDEDGTGPHLPSLFAGGTFYATTEGQLSPLIIRWRKNYITGISGWLSVPEAPGLGTQNAPDLCYNYCSNLPHEGDRPRVTCLQPFDSDGAGPLAPELYIGGEITGLGGAGLAKWNATTGTQWVVGASGRDFTTAPRGWDAYYNLSQAMCFLPVAGNGSVPPKLLVGGGTGARYSCGLSAFFWNTLESGVVTAWSLGGSGPGVSNQPDNTWVTLPASSSGGFGVTTTGTGPFSYQWRKDAAGLVNGTSQGYGNIIGATGPATIIGNVANPITPAAQGWYDVQVSNACGTGFSLRAWMVVQPDAAPYFPIRIDSPVAPVATAIGNSSVSSLYGSAPMPEFFTVLQGVPFAIAPTGSSLWRSKLVAGSATGNKSITIPTSRYGVGQVYTLMNTEAGSTSESVLLTFTASGGRTWSTRLWGGDQVRSFLKLGGVQTATSTDTTPIQDNTGSRLDRQRILLPNDFRTRTLTSITITDEGTDATSRVFLAGLTLEVRPPACGPADVGSVGGQHGADGVLDNNDFVVFLDLFFNSAPAADIGRTGGVAGTDGVFDNNDFIVFIDQFFAAC